LKNLKKHVIKIVPDEDVGKFPLLGTTILAFMVPVLAVVVTNLMSAYLVSAGMMPAISHIGLMAGMIVAVPAFLIWNAKIVAWGKTREEITLSESDDFMSDDVTAWHGDLWQEESK